MVGKEVMETRLEKESAKREAKISDTVVLREGNISLILDSYSDIFSDFDPRPYGERTLSDDFLAECRKAVRDKEDELELRLLLPKGKRNINDEIKIKKRLKDHFRKHHLEKENGIKKVKKEGVLLIFVGMVLMFFSSLLYSETFVLSNILRNVLLVVSEPGGWFLFWIGGEKLVYALREKKPNYDFYRKMNNAKIYFFEY